MRSTLVDKNRVDYLKRKLLGEYSYQDDWEFVDNHVTFKYQDGKFITWTEQ